VKALADLQLCWLAQCGTQEKLNCKCPLVRKV